MDLVLNSTFKRELVLTQVLGSLRGFYEVLQLGHRHSIFRLGVERNFVEGGQVLHFQGV